MIRLQLQITAGILYLQNYLHVIRLDNLQFPQAMEKTAKHCTKHCIINKWK